MSLMYGVVNQQIRSKVVKGLLIRMGTDAIRLLNTSLELVMIMLYTFMNICLGKVYALSKPVWYYHSPL
jgi:hypothetical protein